MEKAVDCDSIQVVNGEGRFDITALENFVKKARLNQWGGSYAVVSIIGPQSSGKSTLLNHLFGTKFTEMAGHEGRGQTTKGIWLSKAAGTDPPILVMDVEGTDGSERGEDDTTFEKQSALFALAVSDTLIINLWCHDVGREKAANRPLLKTVFQVMMRIFSPRKVTLMFVLRDKTKLTSVAWFETKLREDIKKIWDDVVSKAPVPQRTSLSELFNVEVVVLSNYEHEEEQFKGEVLRLRQRFLSSLTRGGLPNDQRRVIPASGFSLSLQDIWKLIKENKDLDLPAHTVMVANVRCGEIAGGKYSLFATEQEWCHIKDAVQAGPVPDFGKTLSEMINTSLSGYESEATDFEEGVRLSKGKELEEKLLLLVQPAFQVLLGHTRSRSLERFRKELHESLSGGEEFIRATQSSKQFCMAQFNKGCADATIRQAQWDTTAVRAELQREIDAHIAMLREAKCLELTKQYEDTLKSDLSGPLEVHLVEANYRTWYEIRELLQHVTKSKIPEYSQALSSYGLDKQAKETLCNSLRQYATVVVEEKARAKAHIVLISMKNRFSEILNGDSKSTFRAWTGNEDFEGIILAACSSVLELLSVMAAIRLNSETDDSIFSTLHRDLLNKENYDQESVRGDVLASSTWDKVPSSKTLIAPVKCKSFWMEFVEDTKNSVQKARGAWKAARDEKLKRGRTEIVRAFTGALGYGTNVLSIIFGIGTT